MKLKIWKQEGQQSNWRVLDYFDIIIHIFKEETRHIPIGRIMGRWYNTKDRSK